MVCKILAKKVKASYVIENWGLEWKNVHNLNLYLLIFFPQNLNVCFFYWLQVDALRLRLEEKETFLNKKTKQLQDLTEEKGTLAGEIRDMKDMLEVKERKINVLQKKVRQKNVKRN